MEKETKYHIIVSILLLFLLAQSLYAITYSSPVFDETAHIGASYYYVTTSEISINREQPPLVKILSGIFLGLLDLNAPSGEWENSQQMEFGKILLYRSGNDLNAILLFARFPVLILSLILGIGIFLFVRKLYGPNAGIFALFLYSFEPTIIGHSSLVTMDIAITVFMFFTMYMMWNFVKSPTTNNAFLVAIPFALAQVTKFSALYLIPIMFILLAFFFYKKLLKLRSIGMLILIIAVISLLTINIFYLFQGTGMALTDTISKDRIEPHIANNPLKELILVGTGLPVPLPENYMIGLSDVILHGLSGHTSFFLGEYSRLGWWYYFPVLFVLKVSVFLLIFIGVSIYFFWKEGFEKPGIAEYIAIIFILMYFAINFFSTINIGIRHVLPVFPFLILLSSKTIKYIKGNRFRIVLVVLAALYALSSLSAAPHYISFFNEAIGNNGYLYASDSNFDWGQDLKELKNYMEVNDIDNIKLHYFGTAEPEYYIQYENLECGKTTGTIAISTQILHDRECYGWLESHEPITRVGSIFIYRI